MEENAQGDEKKYFVLVHGGCHGSRCWYKLQPKLISASHRVSSLNMASSGISPKPINQIHSISSYFDPLIKFMESLPPQEMVVLVGHSYGGHAISKAMENFPEKIYVAIFITARMPGPNLSVPDLMRDYVARSAPPLDNQFLYSQGTVNPMKSFIFGPKYLAVNVYQLCSPEDLTLAIMLVSPMRIFSGEHISNEIVLTKERYGSVHRVYLLCDEDKVFLREHQWLMIEKNPPSEVKEIRGADHMPMMSKPDELCNCLLEIGLQVFLSSHLNIIHFKCLVWYSSFLSISTIPNFGNPWVV